MRKLHILLCFLVIAKGIFAQTLSLGLGVGYGTYSMKSMKENQLSFQQELDLDSRITEEFPAFYNYSISLSRDLSEKISFGGKASYQSTGGRISYSDFSGRIYIDHLIDAIGIEALIYFPISKKKKWVVFSELGVGPWLSALDIVRYVEINGNSNEDVIQFTGISLMSDLSLAVKRSINSFYIQINAGVQIDSKAKLKLREGDGFLAGVDENPIRTDWTGFRSSIYFGINF